jgi:hypothetical protein
MSPEDSLIRSRDVLENAATNFKLQLGSAHPSYLMAAGLALLAEGLLAKIQQMENRLKAIEGALLH